MDPFNRDGRLSESALRRMASEAAGARRHVGGGADNFYTTPGGAVQVPPTSRPQAYVRLDTSTPTTITLPGGIYTVQGYDAFADTWLGSQAGWSETPAVHVWVITSSQSSLGTQGSCESPIPFVMRYPAWLLGSDASGKAIYAIQVERDAFIEVTSLTYQNITNIFDGAGLACYPALRLDTYDGLSSGGTVQAWFSATNTQSFLQHGPNPPGQGTPIVNGIYLARQVGSDSSYIPIFAADCNNLWVTPPATATSPGLPGQYAADSAYFYICYSANLWKRVAIAAW